MINYSIYRIIGNNLPPRHSAEQTLSVVKFILKHEVEHEGCEKHWIINRFVNQKDLDDIESLLKKYKQSYYVIPFDANHFRYQFIDASGMPHALNPYVRNNFSSIDSAALEWIIRHKSQSLININYARNYALSLGRKQAKWTLPLDGWCFLPPRFWEQFIEDVKEHPAAKFVVLPIVRLNDNEDILNSEFVPKKYGEPQIAFRFDTHDQFDERLRYGNRNKAEMLVRLGVPGIWHTWKPAKWDTYIPVVSLDKGNYIRSSYIPRLVSGASSEVESEKYRAISRFAGVMQLSQRMDVRCAKEYYTTKKSFTAYAWSYDSEKQKDVSPSLIRYLKSIAADIIRKPIPTILDKKLTPPSGDPHDYYSISPYTDHATDGSIIGMDGHRREEATVGSVGSLNYDPNALYKFISYTAILTNAGYYLDRQDCFERSADIIKAWLINPETRMNPNFKYAQWRGDEPSCYGLIEARDLWILPDILLLLHHHKYLSDQELLVTRHWALSLLQNIDNDKQAGQAVLLANNIGTWSAALVASIALYTENIALVSILIQRSTLRLTAQIEPVGYQIHEARRSRPLHYSLFNISGWIALASVGQRIGVNLWEYKGVDGQSIVRAIEFISQNRQLFSDYKKTPDYFDQWIDAFNLYASAAQGNAVSSLIIDLDHDAGFLPLLPSLSPFLRQG